MTKKRRPNFIPLFWLGTTSLEVDQGYSLKKATGPIDVGDLTLGKWVKQLWEEPALTSALGTKLRGSKERTADFLPSACSN